LALICACLALATSAPAAVRLPHVFTDHAVLQRDQDIKVWGWARPGEQVTVRLAGRSAAAVADAAGEWRVTLPPLPAGGPHELVVTGENEVRVTDVLVGEVWLASGQSNMEFELMHARDSRQEIQAANYPRLRMLLIPRTSAGLPLNDVRASWFVCVPTNPALERFSAVAFFFGRMIQRELNVPVGLISAAQGATQIEPWTAPEGLAAIPSQQPALEGVRAASNDCRRRLVANLDALEAALPLARAALARGRPLPPEVAMGSALPFEGGPFLYNGMLAPLVPFGLRGALWYQGESNCGDGPRYLDKMKALVAGWRSIWQQGDLAFYYVQITPNRYNGLLPLLLEAQAQAMCIPHTGMAQSTDTCDPSDNYGGGHPRNKQEIGRRLALWALAQDYGRTNLVYSGPQFRALQAEGGRLRVLFDHVDGGLVTRDGKDPDLFEVAGADGKFVPATAKIEGAAVVIGSDRVPQPVAMRCAWQDLAQPNLMNKAGLPVSVFRASLKPPAGEK